MVAFLPILGGLIGGALALFGIWLKLLLDNTSQQKKTNTILRAEWADMARHFDRNVDRLRSMRYEVSVKNRWPERVHIAKLKWPEDTFIFDDASIQYSSATTVSEIYKMRLRIRNANLDVDAAMRVFLNGEKQMFLDTLSFVESRHLRLENLALQLQNQEPKPSPSDKLPTMQPDVGDMLFFDKPLLG